MYKIFKCLLKCIYYADMEADAHDKISLIEDVFNHLDIYRSILVYDDESEFIAIKKHLKSQYYPIMEHPEDKDARIYTIHTKQDPFYFHFHWDTVTHILMLSPSCADFIYNDLLQDCPNPQKIMLINIYRE